MIVSSHVKKIFWLLVIVLAVVTAYAATKFVQYKFFIWLPCYFFEAKENRLSELTDGHVIFMIADHHEPGLGEKGEANEKKWTENYKTAIAEIRDDYQNPVKYTWFYPYDHHNSKVVLALNNMVYDGLGEVEFHWHHGPDTNETFPPKLKEAVAWFNQHGCMLPIGENPSPQFGFVHGNWALDDSRGNPNQCGVRRELDILQKYGCYADFTFSTFGTDAQPSKINSLYYATDTDEAKSYNTGVDLEVGKNGKGFLIFEGPIGWDWHDRRFDCAALEVTSPLKPHRVAVWLDHAPIVKGRDNWLFLKVYTHGSQSGAIFSSGEFRGMLEEVKRYCGEHRLSLHFVTAREAYNIAKAAEAGMTGNPETYRNYLLAPPVNSVVRIPRMLEKMEISSRSLYFTVAQPVSDTSYSMKLGPVTEIKGEVSHFEWHQIAGEEQVEVAGKGEITVKTKGKVRFTNDVIETFATENDGLVYKIGANDNTREP